jgi:hypothetical protein
MIHRTYTVKSFYGENNSRTMANASQKIST